ncbi:histidine phosphatase family protein [Spongisporangium articulatum]|uniref:Histidine phosphatase family protein n=1 Tax=Spongisporangium articulatum TaxID=3362603 RepID=A0ABW8AI87_9ACTN
MPALLLVRHGQASFGSANYDVLSENGHRQAALVGAALRDRVNPEVVVAGSLQRQQKTAAELVSAAGFEVRSVRHGGWDEYDHAELLRGAAGRFGALKTGVAAAMGNSAGVQAALDAALRAWSTSDERWSKGLSFKEFQQGALDALDEALAGDPALVVTSGGVIAAIAAHLLGAGPETFVALNRVSVNTGITTVVRGRSGTSLLTFNEHAHLAGHPDLLTYR